MKKRLAPKVIVKELAVLGTIVFIAYFGNQHLQAWLGQRAIDNTEFEAISFNEALSQAQAQNKPVLVDFAAIWCGACRKLDNAVFAKPDIHALIESKYVFTRLEYESDDRKFFEQYGVDRFPTLMVLNADGEVIKRLSVTLDPEQFALQL